MNTISARRLAGFLVLTLAILIGTLGVAFATSGNPPSGLSSPSPEPTLGSEPTPSASSDVPVGGGPIPSFVPIASGPYP